MRRGQAVDIGILIIGVIIAERGFTPVAHVEIQVRSRRHAPLLPQIKMQSPIHHPIAIPIIRAQQVGPVNAAVARHELPIVGMLSQRPPVVGKIEDRRVSPIKRRVVRLEIFSRRDNDGLGVNPIRRPRVIIRAHNGIGGRIDVVARRSHVAARKHKRLLH